MEEVKAYRSLNGNIYTDKAEAKSMDKQHLITKHFINNIKYTSVEHLFEARDYKKGWEKLKQEIQIAISNNVDKYFEDIKPKEKQLLTDNKDIKNENIRIKKSN